MVKSLQGNGVLCFCRADPDIDHISPIVYRLKKDNPNLNIELLIVDLKNDYANDYRLNFIKKCNITVIHILEVLNINSYFLAAYFKIIKEIDRLSRFNIIRLVFGNLFIRCIEKYFQNKLNNLDCELFMQNTFHQKPKILIFDQSYEIFYDHLCEYASAKNIYTVAVPHGHNILENVLIANHSMYIYSKLADRLHIDEDQKQNWKEEWTKRQQKYKLRFDYIVYENFIIPKRYKEIGLLDNDQIVVLGSARFCDEWVTKLREILPDFTFPVVPKNKLKILFLLFKPVYNGFTQELDRTLKFVSKFPNTFIFIKPHTRNSKYHHLDNNNNVFIDNHYDYPSPSLIDWADLIFFEPTSTSLECLKTDKPTICLKNTHANKLISEKYFNSWEAHCRDDIRDFIWESLNDRSSRTYTKEDAQKYLTDMIEPIDKDVLGLYSGFFKDLLSKNY